MNGKLKYIMGVGALLGAFLYSRGTEAPFMNILNDFLFGAVIGAVLSGLVTFLAPLTLIALILFLTVFLIAILAALGLTKAGHDLLVKLLWGGK